MVFAKIVTLIVRVCAISLIERRAADGREDIAERDDSPDHGVAGHEKSFNERRLKARVDVHALDVQGLGVAIERIQRFAEIRPLVDAVIT